MNSHREQFFQRDSYAVVGDSKRKPFPKLTYEGLRSMGKTVYPVDLGGAATISGDKAFGALDQLPHKVDAVVLEVPRDETLDAVKQVADAGVVDVWMHQKSDTPEALAYCKEHGLDARWGTCAVMYTGYNSYHRIHRGIMKLLRKY